MAKFYWDIEQGSQAWYSKRNGIPSASMFDSVMTPKTQKLSEARKKYACRLIAERVLNWQADSLERVENIANGRANEPYAVAQLELVYNIETFQIGHVTTNDGRFGASPDRVAGISNDRTRVSTVIEAKAPTVPVQFERLIFEDEAAYVCQRQGQIWVAEADKSIFYSYVHRTPGYRVETGRDEPFIKKLVDCLEKFSDELDQWEAIARSRGAFEPFQSLVTPLDAELGEELRHTPLGDDLPAAINRQVQDWGTDESPLPEGYAWD